MWQKGMERRGEWGTVPEESHDQGVRLNSPARLELRLGFGIQPRTAFILIKNELRKTVPHCEQELKILLY